MDRHEQLQAAGRWLREQREHRGMSVRELANALNASTQAVYNWETGKTGVDAERAGQLADAFGVREVDVWRALGLPLPRDDRPPPEDPYWRKLEKLRLAPEDHGLVARLLSSSQDKRVNAGHALVDFLAGRASRERKRQVLDHLLAVERRQYEEWERAQDVIRIAAG